MGEQGFLLKDIRRIMKLADEIGYIENLQGTSADDIDAQNFGGIIDQLDQALRDAKGVLKQALRLLKKLSNKRRWMDIKKVSNNVVTLTNYVSLTQLLRNLNGYNSRHIYG